MKYMIGQVIHLLLEQALEGKVLRLETIIEKIGCNPKIAQRLLDIATRYKKSKIVRWLQFFNRYNSNWSLHIEKRIHNIIPDILLINHKRKKIVIVDIKTGKKSKRRTTKVIIQLYKYFNTLKFEYPNYKIHAYVFWAKYGEFESFGHLIAEIYRSINSITNTQKGGRYVKSQESK